MKYNIVTVSNESYKVFLKVFLKSLFDNADSDNLNSVFVFDTGLSDHSKEELSINEKIQFVPTDISAESSGIHDEGWAKNTYSKTKFLFYVLNSTREPSLLIDVDSVFQSNFEEKINWGADFSVCLRGRGHHICDYIGSFFGAINSNASLLFLQVWMLQLKVMTQTKEIGDLKGEKFRGFNHFESPSLSNCIKNFGPFLNFQELEEDEVSCVKENSSAKIYHLKSDGFALTIEERLELHYAKHLVDKYV